MGYRTYQITPCEQWPEFEAQAVVRGMTVENFFYRLEIDRQEGVIASLMAAHTIGCVPIVDTQGVPFQIVSRTDILRALIDKLQDDAVAVA